MANSQGVDVAARLVQVANIPVASAQIGTLASPSWTANLRAVGIVPAKRGRFAKRALDVVIAGVVLALTLPFYPLIALAIRLDSRGPALFRQVRIGKDGRAFVVYKFRSMHYSDHAVDPVYHEIASKWLAGVPLSHPIEQPPTPQPRLPSASQPRAPRGKYKLANDPRITRVGRFLRKTSIDELPQFLNVLKGDMSVVGPRPGIPFEVERYSLRDTGRLLVKPGITGLWQVRGRGHVTFQQMIELDLKYVGTNGFWRDIGLILLTIPAVLIGSGAA